MHIRDIFAASKPSLSFEFFPPRDAPAWEDLYQTIRELEPLRPSFVSVTYGAGGNTRELTHELVLRLKQSTSIPPLAVKPTKSCRPSRSSRNGPTD